MKLYCWEGYNQKKYLKNFKYKISPNSFISDFQIAKEIRKKTIRCNILNINNAYIRDYLWKYGLIEELNYSNYGGLYDDYLKYFRYLSKWTKSIDKKKLIGIGQRFGSFNFVINTKAVSRIKAELNGYNLIKELKRNYGILLFEDFNIMHIALAAGVNPFKKLNSLNINEFTNTCKNWLQNASIISDNFILLNKELNAKNISLYLSGGTYTCSIARKEGFKNILAITPKNKINNVKQGIIFTEITSILKNKNIKQSEKFIQYILKPEKCYEIAMSKLTCNPVLQMGNKKIFSKFTINDLNIIQWNDISNIKKYSHEYQIVPDYKKLLSIFRKELNKNKKKII